MGIVMVGFFKYILVIILHFFLMKLTNPFFAIILSIFVAYVVTKTIEKEKFKVFVILICAMSIYLLSLNIELSVLALVPVLFFYNDSGI